MSTYLATLGARFAKGFPTQHYRHSQELNG